MIGGWGTRGKSGTERLKAALLNAAGLSLLSKTTGCEAMVLHSAPFGKLRELFLFRPYDKATIWEQQYVVRLASKLGVQAFLWECMALTPQYVRVLQRDWMKDDLSTITNTFPDHEDLQGPAGINIPEVIADFIPTRSKVLTSEEQMLPILRDAARGKCSHLLPVTWREANLIPSDVLARFPYQEHPDNIALVTAMAEELGFSREFAWKEMADRVVPDLGVLKTSAPARLRSRTLEFSNGMSANERFGSLGNWRRLGFDQHDIERQPEVWISAVVNNRSDRVPRSKVFAGILVSDIRVDRFYLIGSNLNGLMGFVREAWEKMRGRWTLRPRSSASETTPHEQLIRWARDLRIPWSRAVAVNRLRSMITGQTWQRPLPDLDLEKQSPSQIQKILAGSACPNVDEIISFFESDLEAVADFEHLKQQIDSGASLASVDERLRQFFSKWFFAKFVVVDDYHATGNQIVDLIAKTTPPGLRNRIMGMQNIKGTGLDFVYTWQAWDACHEACAQLVTGNPALVEKAVATLANFEGFNLLCEEHVRAIVQGKLSAAEPTLQPQLTKILERMDAALGIIRDQMSRVRSTGFVEKLVNWTEAWVDALDAVRRRRRADRVFADLCAERISQARAAVELQALTQRQKGGWLRKLHK